MTKRKRTPPPRTIPPTATTPGTRKPRPKTPRNHDRGPMRISQTGGMS